MQLERAIAAGITAMDCAVPGDAAARLATFIDLLARWNQVYNLTAVRCPDQMVDRHILDSLSILPWLQGPRVLDVGSGAGLPGMPLAIAQPEFTFYLLDSNLKRTRFMTQAAAELGLDNVHVVRARLEDYQTELRFNSILCRAFGTLATMLAGAGRLSATDGRFLAMKGRRPDAELAALPAGYTVVGVYPSQAPGQDAERHLVHLIHSDAEP